MTQVRRTFSPLAPVMWCVISTCGVKNHQISLSWSRANDLKYLYECSSPSALVSMLTEETSEEEEEEGWRLDTCRLCWMETLRTDRTWPRRTIPYMLYAFVTIRSWRPAIFGGSGWEPAFQVPTQLILCSHLLALTNGAAGRKPLSKAVHPRTRVSISSLPAAAATTSATCYRTSVEERETSSGAGAGCSHLKAPPLTPVFTCRRT